MEKHIKERVFITGINGFTGEHLERYLVKKDYDVYGTVFSKPKKDNHFYCDISDKNSISEIINKVRPKYIIHLAAISFVATEDQLKVYEVNVFGTLNLLDAVEKANYIPEKILIASSAVVYGAIEGEIKESIIPSPINHYGNSKLVMENMVKPYFNKLNIIITRPFNYTGVGQEKHFLIPKIVLHFKEKKDKIKLGNINVYREFNDVRFVIESYFSLMKSEQKSLIVNVCSGKETNIKNILKTMECITGHKMEVEIAPEFIRKNEIKILKGSTEKINEVIGQFGETYTLKDTLKRMYEN